MPGSLSKCRATARRIGSGVSNEGNPQLREATSPILAARMAISLIADIAMPDTVLETRVLGAVILLLCLRACLISQFMLPASDEQ